jgi:hypothetical protein
MKPERPRLTFSVAVRLTYNNPASSRPHAYHVPVSGLQAWHGACIRARCNSRARHATVVPVRGLLACTHPDCCRRERRRFAKVSPWHGLCCQVWRSSQGCKPQSRSASRMPAKRARMPQKRKTFGGKGSGAVRGFAYESDAKVCPPLHTCTVWHQKVRENREKQAKVKVFRIFQV